jgi:TonB-dependent starch-binding outer membrane protein SusC
MKKYRDYYQRNLYGSQLKKILRIMKMTLFLSMVTVCQLLAVESYSQMTRLTVKLENTKIADALKTIEDQSDFFFLYSPRLIDVEKTISVDAENEPIKVILEDIFENDVKFAVYDRQIILTKNDATEILTELQQKQVTGIISDAATGEPLIGATVVVEGSTTGVVTGIDGKFSFDNLKPDAVLLVSYVGYLNTRVVVAGQTSINIKMTADTKNLDEVVVIGYGTQKKIEVTSAVSNVKAAEFIKGSVKDAGQLLQGKVAGLTVSTISGDPTAPSQLVLRGTATLSTSTQPLILIDGIPGDLNTVAPEDIESIDVLKDGSASAIYGTRGTNGVILLTTKRPNGRIEPSVTYEGYLSTQNFVRVPKMLNAAEYRQRLAEGVAFTDLGATTDWVKEISRDTPLNQNHRLSFHGGNAKSNYLASFNYRQLQGVVLKSDYTTLNSRVDLNHSMFDDKLKFNLNVIDNDNKSWVDFASIGEGLSDSESSNVFNQALYRNPTAPVQNPDGTWNENTSISYYENPVGLLMETYGGNQWHSTRLSGSIILEPVKNLRFKALVSRSKSNNNGGQGQTKRHLTTVRDGYNGYASKTSGQSVDKLLELSAEYVKAINSHNLSVLAGYSYQESMWESAYQRNWNFPAGNYSYIDNIGVGIKSGTGGPNMQNSSKYEKNLIGFFGRVTYNYKEKYLLMANLRYEAASQFVGTKQPWGTFPSVSAGWRISEEEFMKSISFISDLKLRVGYGVTGTAPDELFLGVSMLGYNGSSLINGQWVPSLSPTSNPNPYLRWEEKKETNIGIDFGLFAGKISGSIDIYKRRTDGLLYDYSVPTPPNAYGTTKANVGVMDNKGIEILVNATPVQKNKFTWLTGVTFSTNTNKLVSLENDLYKTTNPWFNAGYTGSPISTYTHRIEVGKPIGNFYGYKVTGITDDGQWIYEDKDGNPSATRVEEDKKILGNGLPKYYASWNNTLKYGNLDLNITMRGAFGYKILNYQRMYTENQSNPAYNMLSSAFDKVFGKAVLDKNIPVEYNSYYLENGNFWKIDNINLGYNFSGSKVKHLGPSRLYFSILNALIFTGYKGMDPEVNRLGLTPGNDDRNKYPSTRVYTIGWSVTIN